MLKRQEKIVIRKSPIKYDDETLLGSDVLFNKAYYESTYNNFMSFFRRPLSSNSMEEPAPKEDKNEWDLEAR